MQAQLATGLVIECCEDKEQGALRDNCVSILKFMGSENGEEDCPEVGEV